MSLTPPALTLPYLGARWGSLSTVQKGNRLLKPDQAVVVELDGMARLVRAKLESALVERQLHGSAAAEEVKSPVDRLSVADAIVRAGTSPAGDACPGAIRQWHSDKVLAGGFLLKLNLFLLKIKIKIYLIHICENFASNLSAKVP